MSASFAVARQRARGLGLGVVSSALLALGLGAAGCGSDSPSGAPAAGGNVAASGAASAGTPGAGANAGAGGGSVAGAPGASGSSSAGAAGSIANGDSGSGGAPAGGNAGAGGATTTMWTTNGTKYSLNFGSTYFEVDAGLGARITSFKAGGGELLANAADTGIEYYWGSTFWPSPQNFILPPTDPTIANIDRNPYTAKLEGAVLTLTSAVNEGNPKLSVVKKFSADVAKEAVVIEYTMINGGTGPITAAPWEVTRVVGGGLTFYPEASAPVLHDNSLLMPPTTASAGARWFQHDTSVVKATKFFADGKDGWISHVTGPNKDLLLIKAFPDIQPNQSPAGEAEVEIYAVPTYVEVEQQGAVQTLAVGESSAHWTVRWYARKLAASPAVGSADLVTYVQNQIK
jgi:hypothetical protein